MRYFVLIFTFFAFVSCSKDQTPQIPDVWVDFKFTAIEFENATINSSHTYWVKDGHGVAGLIIIKQSIGQYIAFERCSPVNPEKRCAVVPENNGLTAKDPCSGAEFILSEGGYPSKIATRPLKEYAIRVVGNQFIVSN